MRRALLAGMPCDPQSGGEAVKIRRRWLVRAMHPAPIHSLAEFSLRGAYFGNEHNRIGAACSCRSSCLLASSVAAWAKARAAGSIGPLVAVG